jgi:hypothetical protein
MFPVAMSRPVGDRRRDDDRDLGQVRRDRETDRSTDRLAEPEALGEGVRRVREPDASEPHGARGEREPAEKEGEGQAASPSRIRSAKAASFTPSNT